MNYIEELKKNHPNLSQSSLKTYESILKSLGVKKDSFTSPNLYINELKDKNISSKKTALSALYVLTGNQKYKDEMMKTIDEYNKDIDKQEKTEKQSESWIEKKKIDELIDHYKKNLNYYYKTKDYSKIQEYIILVLMTGIMVNPRRLKDYTDFKIKNIDKDKDNYLERKKLIFNSYKGSDKKGKSIIPITTQLNNILRKWININPHEYLFFNEKGNKLSNVVLNQRLNKIFKSKVSVNALRHSFLTDKHLQTLKAMDELDKDMKDMGSSMLQAKLYIKKD